MRIFLVSFLFFCFAFDNASAQNSDLIKITAVGDIMMGTAYPNGAFLPKYNTVRLFKPLLPYIENADLSFGNLEGALTDDISEVKPSRANGRSFRFAMPTAYSATLKEVGFDLLSLANNHLNDFGRTGRRSTRKTLRSQGIHFAGLQECPVDIFTRDGVRYGFCAFAPNATTNSIKELKRATQIVHYLDSLTDVVIVSFHAGGEGSYCQNVTRRKEYYLGEDRGNVYQFAHKMIDAGADVLLGHGPHVTRAVEVYKKRFITYSMGNFCTYSRVSVMGLCGIAPLFQIYINGKGEFQKAQIIPTFQQKNQPPRLDEKKRAVAIIQKLTKTDFPEMANVIRITNDGWIQKVSRNQGLIAENKNAERKDSVRKVKPQLAMVKTVTPNVPTAVLKARVAEQTTNKVQQKTVAQSVVNQVATVKTPKELAKAETPKTNAKVPKTAGHKTHIRVSRIRSRAPLAKIETPKVGIQSHFRSIDLSAQLEELERQSQLPKPESKADKRKNRKAKNKMKDERAKNQESEKPETKNTI